MEQEIQMDYVRKLMAQIDERSRMRTERAKGVAEGQAKTNRENAKKFKDLGVEPEIICQATGLTAEEVAAL